MLENMSVLSSCSSILKRRRIVPLFCYVDTKPLSHSWYFSRYSMLGAKFVTSIATLPMKSAWEILS